MAKYLIGKSSKLQFDIPPIKIKREDNIVIRNKVLSLTPEDSKRLGINKSTLWYIQRHIKEGKRIKVYGKVMGKIKWWCSWIGKNLKKLQARLYKKN